MKKIIFILLTLVMVLSFTVIAESEIENTNTTFSEKSEISNENNGIYFSFADRPATLLRDAKLNATVRITWADTPTVGIAQWYVNGSPIEGWRNENFKIETNVTSTLNYDYPRWESMPLEATFGFSLTVNGKTQYIEERINIESMPYSYYHKEESDRVLELIKHVYVEATLNKGVNAYTSYKLDSICGWLDKGTKVKYIDYYDINHPDFTHTHVSAQLLLENGYTCWVPHSAINISTKNYTVYTDYDNKDKETFVNAKDYKSDTEYLVWISLERQKINVFKGSQGKWNIYAVFPCATGKNSTPTIDGVFKYSKYTPRWNFGSYYVKYVLIFNGGHAFHSRTYRTATDKLLDETIGTTTSLGCVRMYDEDVIWMKDNLPLGSTVMVY